MTKRQKTLDVVINLFKVEGNSPKEIQEIIETSFGSEHGLEVTTTSAGVDDNSDPEDDDCTGKACVTLHIDTHIFLSRFARNMLDSSVKEELQEIVRKHLGENFLEDLPEEKIRSFVEEIVNDKTEELGENAQFEVVDFSVN